MLLNIHALIIKTSWGKLQRREGILSQRERINKSLNPCMYVIYVHTKPMHICYHCLP